MNNWNPQLLKKTKEFVSALIYKMREGESIWFSYDKETGHSGPWEAIEKVAIGDEFTYYVYGQGSPNKYEMEDEEEVNQFVDNIVKHPNLNYYTFQTLQGYKKQPYEGDPDRDIGDYEKYGPDPIRWQDVYEGKKTNVKIKRELLEHLIQVCVKEILNNEEETVGAPAPPADGLGTADQPPIPKQPSPPLAMPAKGVVLVEPSDSAKLRQVPLKYKDDSQLERSLYRVGSVLAGPKVQIPINTTRLVKDGISHPASPVYLYISKEDLESEDVFLMATKDLYAAQQDSLSPEDLQRPASPIPTSDFEPLSSDSDEFATRMSSGGATPRAGIDELKKAIKKIVKEAFLSEMMGSSQLPSQQNQLATQQNPMIDPTQPPVDAMTPIEKAKFDREQEKGRQEQLKSLEQKLKTTKKEMDFQKQKVDQSKRFDIPIVTQQIQQLKGSTRI